MMHPLGPTTLVRNGEGPDKGLTRLKFLGWGLTRPIKEGGQCSWLDGCSGGAWTQADHLGDRVRAPNVMVEQAGASRSHLARRGGVPLLFLAVPV